MKRIILLALASALVGCANMPPELSKIGNQAQQAMSRLSGQRGASLDVPLPLDGIKARDAKLTEVLGKVGKFAVKHTKTEPMIVMVYAPQADHDYLVRSIKAGIPAEMVNAIAVMPVADDSQLPRVTVRTVRESKPA